MSLIIKKVTNDGNVNGPSKNCKVRVIRGSGNTEEESKLGNIKLSMTKIYNGNSQNQLSRITSVSVSKTHNKLIYSNNIRYNRQIIIQLQHHHHLLPKLTYKGNSATENGG